LITWATRNLLDRLSDTAEELRTAYRG
jgi:hypothetical protein